MSESWAQRLFGGFRKTSERLSENLSGITENLTAAVTKTKLDEDQLDDLEDALILSDLGPRAARSRRSSAPSPSRWRSLPSRARR